MKMSRQLFLKWVLLSLGGGILLLAGLFAFQRSPVQIEGYLDEEKTIWYTAGEGSEDPDNTGVAINWQHGETDLEKIHVKMDHYVDVSRKVGKELLKQNVNRFYIGVVFRHYVSLDEFEQIANETGVQIQNFAVRGTLPNVDPTVRYSFFGGPAGDKIFDKKSTERALEQLKHSARDRKADQLAAQRTGDPDAEGEDEFTPEEINAIPLTENDVVLNGIYTFEAITDAGGYRRIRNHPSVYHVDVTATWVYEQIKDRITWEKFFERAFNLTGYHTFWDMENIGLDKFKEK